MTKIIFYIFLLLCANSNAHCQDSLDCDSNLIGNWELYSYVLLNHDKSVKDSVAIDLDSVYWNVIWKIQLDSAQVVSIPTDKRKDLPHLVENCFWSIHKEDDRIWITMPCGNTLQGTHEIVFLSESQLRTFYEYHEDYFILQFRRID